MVKRSNRVDVSVEFFYESTGSVAEPVLKFKRENEE
jgi:hypothetical protein